jgi:hypothetical protein
MTAVAETRDLLVAVFQDGLNYRIEAMCGYTERSVAATLADALAVAQRHEDECENCRG